MNNDQCIGIEIVRNAITALIKQLISKCWFWFVSNNRKNSRKNNPSYGYDMQYTDMLGIGIIDPLKVVRTALQNAASIAGLIITTEVIIVETKKENLSHQAPLTA